MEWYKVTQVTYCKQASAISEQMPSLYAGFKCFSKKLPSERETHS